MGNFTVGLVPHPTKSVARQRRRSSAAGRPASHEAHVRLVAHGRRRVARVGDGVELVDERSFRDASTSWWPSAATARCSAPCGWSPNGPCPCSGVNYGNVGFLVEVEPHELPEALERLGAEAVLARAAPRPRGHAPASGIENTYLAFNDVSVARRPGEGVVIGRPRPRRHALRLLQGRRDRRRDARRLDRLQLRRGRADPVARRRGRRGHPGRADVGHRPLGGARPARAAAVRDRRRHALGGPRGRRARRRRRERRAASSRSSLRPDAGQVIRLDAGRHGPRGA